MRHPGPAQAYSAPVGRGGHAKFSTKDRRQLRIVKLAGLRSGNHAEGPRIFLGARWLPPQQVHGPRHFSDPHRIARSQRATKVSAEAAQSLVPVCTWSHDSRLLMVSAPARTASKSQFIRAIRLPSRSKVRL